LFVIKLFFAIELEKEAFREKNEPFGEFWGIGDKVMKKRGDNEEDERMG
jgi:hypothetical protein